MNERDRHFTSEPRRKALGALLCVSLVAACTGQIDSLGPPSAGAGGGEPSTAEPDPVAQHDPTPLVCTDLGRVGAPVPMRRLTASQVTRTIAEVLGVTQSLSVTDERVFTYRSNVATAIDASAARSYYDFAELVSAKAVLTRCPGSTCLPWLLDELGLTLFRRPLSKEERARYADLFTKGEADGARWVISAMVQSPTFLYLDEVETAQGYLDDYSIAARLSLVLWGQNPDLPLLKRAAMGGLASEAAILEQAERMLSDPRSEGGLREFVDQWLELGRLDDPDARPDLKALGPQVVAALRAEPVRMFQALVTQEGGLRELLTTRETVKLEALASIYAGDVLSTSASSSMLDPSKRAGILSLPGVMASLAHAGATSPTLRGYAVLASFLCAPPPPPPAGVKVTLPEVAPDATPREKLEAHFSDASCGSCHRSMDGIGFAFERIDWLGRSRGGAGDAVSTFFLSGRELEVDGVAELAEALADSDAVADCVGKQFLRYATGVQETPDAACLSQRMRQELPERNGLKQMMLTYLTSDWFRRARALP